MSILNKVFRNEKVLINIFSAILFVFGILFGIIYYFYGNEALLNLCKYIFFFKDNEATNNYNLYITITSFYIFLSLIISTSFLGTIFNSFVIFTKGMQLSIASIFYFTLNTFDASMLFLGFFPQKQKRVIKSNLYEYEWLLRYDLNPKVSRVVRYRKYLGRNLTNFLLYKYIKTVM